jgi:hypothetical protein
MKQSTGVHKFECRTGVDDALVKWVSASPYEPPEAESGPQAFASRENQPTQFAKRLGEIFV